MSTPFDLRSFRKKTDLTQTDIGFIMNLPDYSNISRWEKGLRKPTAEMLLVYHLLFEIPFENLFQELKESLCANVVPRIGLLIHELKKQEPSRKVNSRIAFLTAVLKRLTA